MAFESIGGVWVKKDKNGNRYLSIQIGNENYKAFTNKFKNEEKHPDFRIVKNDTDWQRPAPTNEPDPFAGDDKL